ncbi:hypothetical protein ROZALSC1DRAFT_15208, partial [Rozella allomycis CSF55]
VGEPGLGRCLIVKRILELEEKDLLAVEKGSSTAGLVGVVVNDSETGMKKMQLGALPLANSSILSFDEFDRLGSDKMKSLHEAMALGSVSLAKAGLSTTVPSKCSIVAACNPVSGSHSTEQKVGMPLSLLTRFDLVTMMTDSENAGSDTGIFLS